MAQIATVDGPVFRVAAGRAPQRTMRRVILAALLAVAIALSTVAFGMMSARADGPAAPIPVRVHTVIGGETLWGIAQGAAGEKDDVRDVLLTIAEFNGLTGDRIVPGMRIMVPLN